MNCRLDKIKAEIKFLEETVSLLNYLGSTDYALKLRIASQIEVLMNEYIDIVEDYESD